jgi:hypothetical protein
MTTDWDLAHTDYTTAVTRPGPTGLTHTEADWRHLLKATPNGQLLAHNSTTQHLTSGKPVYLMHTTVALDAIRTSGQLFASTGCLLAALYCAPLTAEADGLRPHNLGSYLLRTKGHHTDTIIFEITPERPMPALGTDYLHAGPIHLDTYQRMRSYLTPAEDTDLRTSVVTQLHAVADFLRSAFATASGAKPGTGLLDQLSAAVPAVPFLGYLYFEAASEYLMLHSTSRATKALAERGEINSVLSKQLAFAAAAGMEQLFDLAKFAPTAARLDALIAGVEPALQPAAGDYVTRRLSHLLAHLALPPSAHVHGVDLAATDFDTLADQVPGLVGQLVFRHIRVMPRYPQLYLAFEQDKALSLWGYWNQRGVTVPFNGHMPKGEVGVNTGHPNLNLRAWTSRLDTNGNLHPDEELSLTPVPRLADLALTAMRRNASGNAAGHPRRTPDRVASPAPGPGGHA